MALTERERKLLERLTENPFLTQVQLAEEIGLSRSATANLLSGLQQKGYIEGKAYVLRKSVGITCIGGANVDHKALLLGPHQPGTSNPIRSVRSPGGVMRNLAENLGRLGEDVHLMTIVGNDADGSYLLDNSVGLFSTHLTDRSESGQTGSYHAILATDGSLVAGYADMEICEHMDREWIESKRADFRRSKWVVADGNLDAGALEALVEYARTDAFQLCLIGVSAPKMKRMPRDLKGLDVMICNVDESQSYFETDEVKAERLCRLWLDAGVKKAVVTAGAGSVAYGEDQVHLMETETLRAEDIEDVTGAGDAFSAGVLYGLAHGESLKKACHYGAANAKSTIRSKDSVQRDLTKEKLIEEEKKYGQ